MFFYRELSQLKKYLSNEEDLLKTYKIYSIKANDSCYLNGFHFISNEIIPLLFPYSTIKVRPPIKVVPNTPPTQAGTIPKVDLNRTPETPPQSMFF